MIRGASFRFSNPTAITSNGRGVWVANGGGKSVTQLNASTGKLVRVVSGSSDEFAFPDAITSDAAYVWVANYRGQAVLEINAITGALVKVHSGSPYGLSGPDAITSDGSHVFTGNYFGQSVTMFPVVRSPGRWRPRLRRHRSPTSTRIHPTTHPPASRSRP